MKNLNQEELLKNLTRLDFMAMDLALYLDTHQNDVEAIELYNKITTSSNSLRKAYEETYGPLQSFGVPNHCENEWLWGRDPWPWENQYNFSL